MDTTESKTGQEKKRKKGSTGGPETLDKLSNHTKGLFEDLTAWFELKVQYIILDYQEQLARKAKGVLIEVAALLVFGIACIFGLVALALGLGDVLSHPAWGFVIVGALLCIIAFIIRMVGKRIRSLEDDTSATETYQKTKENLKLTGRTLPESSVSQNGKD